MFHLQQPATTCKTSLASTLPRQSTHIKHAVANTSFPSVALCCMSSTCEVERRSISCRGCHFCVANQSGIRILSSLSLPHFSPHFKPTVFLQNYFNHFTMSSRHPPPHVISDQVAHLIKSTKPLVSAASAWTVVDDAKWRCRQGSQTCFLTQMWTWQARLIFLKLQCVKYWWDQEVLKHA